MPSRVPDICVALVHPDRGILSHDIGFQLVHRVLLDLALHLRGQGFFFHVPLLRLETGEVSHVKGLKFFHIEGQDTFHESAVVLLKRVSRDILYIKLSRALHPVFFVLGVADISRHPGPVLLAFRLDPSVDLAAVHQVREVHTGKLLDLVFREEVIRNIFFLLDPVKEDSRRLLLIHGKGDHIVRQKFPGKLSREHHRVVAVIAERRHRRCVRHDLRSAARADVYESILVLLFFYILIIHSAGLRRFQRCSFHFFLCKLRHAELTAKFLLFRIKSYRASAVGAFITY